MIDPTAPIGIFDSGIGGLSILKLMHEAFPHERLLYLGDQAHVPYGQRSATDIRRFSAEITRHFLRRNVKLMVVACNTATAAALNYLREMFPNTAFVGMEPAVKPAAAQTRTGQVGVLATAGTFVSPRYASLMTRYAQNVVVHEDPCLGLVERIEAGDLTSAETRSLLTDILTPMQAAQVDTLVLGCTHYPFVRPLLEELAPTMTLIDPAPAVVKQVERVLSAENSHAPASQTGSIHLTTTGDAQALAQLARVLLGEEVTVASAEWHDGPILTSAKSAV